jgi:hypothetical protein
MVVRTGPATEVVGQRRLQPPLRLRRDGIGSRCTAVAQIVRGAEPADCSGLEDMPVGNRGDGPARRVVDDDDRRARGETTVEESGVRRGQPLVLHPEYAIRLTMSSSWFRSCMRCRTTPGFRRISGSATRSPHRQARSGRCASVPTAPRDGSPRHLRRGSARSPCARPYPQGGSDARRASTRHRIRACTMRHMHDHVARRIAFSPRRTRADR